MNTTTTTTTVGTSRNTTTFSLDQIYALYTNPVIVVRFYQIGYAFTFLLGVFGNTASLFTFSRPTLRKVSTGCLFIVLAISDMMYLFICLFDFLEFGLQIPFYRKIAYDELCRFRSFMLNAAQVASAWILVIVSIDRWIRTRFPFKSNSICTPKKALIAVAVLLLLDIALHSHLLTPMFGMLIPGFSVMACGPNIYNPSYVLFYFMNWTIIQIFTSCLLPAMFMFIMLIDIFINVRIRKKAVVQPNQGLQQDKNAKRQSALQKQMFILMFASICIFLITNLPVAIYKITSPRESNISFSIFRIITVWVALLWFQSLNYAINFYIHCLSSTLFRKEFRQQMNTILGKNTTPISAMELTKTARIPTHHMSVKY